MKKPMTLQESRASPLPDLTAEEMKEFIKLREAEQKAHLERAAKLVFGDKAKKVS